MKALKKTSQIRKELSDTIYDKHGNTFLMHESIKIWMGRQLQRKITSFTTYHINSLQSDNVEDIGEINNYRMI